MEKDMEKINEHRRDMYHYKKDGKLTTDHGRPINGKAWYSDEQFCNMAEMNLINKNEVRK
jgi:hypothetical protein